MRTTVITPLLFLFGLSGAASADTVGDTIKEQLPEEITPILHVRPRYEFRDDENNPLDANALTLRLRYGVKVKPADGFEIKAVGQTIARLGGDFNDLSGRYPQYPVVADRANTQIYELYGRFTAVEGVDLKVGRQVYELGNARFVGNAPWRQSAQTYDMAKLTVTPTATTEFTYGYIEQVNRIFGDVDPVRGQFNGDIHVGEAVWTGQTGLTTKGYFLLADLEEAPGLSSATYGVQARYKHNLDGANVTVHGEYAIQTDHGRNTADFTEDYIKFEVDGKTGPWRAQIGWERLGGDGTNRVTTPLANLFKVQGFANAFLNTPTVGLDDVYANLFYTVGDVGPVQGVRLGVWVHDYSAVTGGADLGEEINAAVFWSTGPIKWDARFVAFGGSDLQGDITQVLVMATYNF